MWLTELLAIGRWTGREWKPLAALAAVLGLWAWLAHVDRARLAADARADRAALATRAAETHARAVEAYAAGLAKDSTAAKDALDATLQAQHAHAPAVQYVTRLVRQYVPAAPAGVRVPAPAGVPDAAVPTAADDQQSPGGFGEDLAHDLQQCADEHDVLAGLQRYDDERATEVKPPPVDAP